MEELYDEVRPFSDLTGPEVSVLPAKLQFYVPSISCDQLNARPAGSILDPDELVVACDANGQKNLLDASSVLGTDVRDANATLQAGAASWEVALQFTGDGQSRWTDLTREAVQNDAAVPFDRSQLQMNVVIDEETGEWRSTPTRRSRTTGTARPRRSWRLRPADPCGPTGDDGNCSAAVLDNRVVTAPQIQQVIQAGPDHRQLHWHAHARQPASVRRAVDLREAGGADGQRHSRHRLPGPSMPRRSVWAWS